MPQFAPKPTYNPTANALVANQRLAIGAAAVAFAAFNANTSLVGLEVQTANVYVTFDGTTPSSTNGNTLYAAQTYHWDVYTAQSAKFIQVSGAAVIMAIELAGVTGQTIPPATDIIKPAPWGTGVGTFTSLTVSGASNLTTLDLNGTAVSTTAGHFQIGSGTQTTIGANGAASALTANPLGYLVGYVGTTKVVIPYYNG